MMYTKVKKVFVCSSSRKNEKLVGTDHVLTFQKVRLAMTIKFRPVKTNVYINVSSVVEF